MTIRDQFVKDFSEQEAISIEKAAEEHRNGIHDNEGSDPFKWALCICIGYQCMECDNYREYHGIKTSWIPLKQWIKDKADLKSHDGSFDYLGAFAGIYDEYVKDK